MTCLVFSVISSGSWRLPAALMYMLSAAMISLAGSGLLCDFIGSIVDVRVAPKLCNMRRRVSIAASSRKDATVIHRL